MSDPLSGLLGLGRGPARAPRRPTAAASPARRCRAFRLFVAIVIMAGVAAGVIFGAKAIISNLTHTTKVEDYAGRAPAGRRDHPQRPERHQHRQRPGGQGRRQERGRLHQCRAKADPARASKIQPGDYLLRSHMSGAAAFALLFDPKARNAQPYTIAEGLNMRQALPSSRRATGLKLADLTGRSQQPAAARAAHLGRRRHQRRRLPLPGDVRAEARAPARSMCCGRWWRASTSKHPARHRHQGARRSASPRCRSVTLASIVEKEVNQTADLARPRLCMFNRLHDTADFPTLGMDSTTRYATTNFTEPLTAEPAGDQQPVQHPGQAGHPAGPDRHPGRGHPEGGAVADPGQLDVLRLPAEGESDRLHGVVQRVQPASSSSLPDETGGG